MPTTFSDWRDLPFREIWVEDTEYYPGPGLANGGQDGDQITPLCLSALEMRSGRIVRRWQDGLGPFPPFRLDADAIVCTYMATAEAGFHLAQGWGQPAGVIDAYVEFRHLTNDGRVKSGDRPKGYYSLAGALRFFGEDELDTGHKTEMRDRILQGPPFTAQEREAIIEYCCDDVRALARLVTRLVPRISSLEHALFRGQYSWLLAHQERRGIPIDLPRLTRIREHWDTIKTELVTTIDSRFGCYEIIDGVPHFRDERFRSYLQREGITWPTYDDGSLDKRAETFGDMAKLHPHIEDLRELRSTLSKLRLNKLAVGRDGRNRTLLNPYGTKTGRNAPSNSKFVMGPSKWTRFLITPPPGLALVHRDFSQEEVRIAGVLARDRALIAACEDGDVYLGIAKRLGLVGEDATPETHADVRRLFKVVVLGILYGLGAQSLAAKAGISRYEAHEILARLRAEFRVFEEWSANNIDRAGLQMQLSTAFGWTMLCPPGTSFRTIRNWPIQSCGSEILHVACILAERRHIRLVAPIHDAFIAEGPVADIADISAELDRVMRDASSIVLQGYELPTSPSDPIRPGERYHDERGENLWNTVNWLLADIERRTA